MSTKNHYKALARKLFEISSVTKIAIDDTEYNKIKKSYVIDFGSKYGIDTRIFKTTLEIASTQTDVSLRYDPETKQFFFMFVPKYSSYDHSNHYFSFLGNGKSSNQKAIRELEKGILAHFESMENRNLQVANKLVGLKDKIDENLKLIDAFNSRIEVSPKYNTDLYKKFLAAVESQNYEFGDLDKIAGGNQWDRVRFYATKNNKINFLNNDNFDGIKVVLPDLNKVKSENLDKVMDIIRMIEEVNS